jgi:sulfur-carrier protein adenylyltransferase/sulfurtransferase
MPLSAAETERYARHLSLAEVGIAGQERLQSARVLVVGAGGLGSPVALYLAAAGIGTLGIVDCDQVELSNLQRQILHETRDLGQPKALSAARRLRALNPEIGVVPHALELRAENVGALVAGYDLIVDGSDRIATRYLVNDACVSLRKPLVSAAIHRFEGQAMTYVPGAGGCYRCLFPDASTSPAPSCADAGVLGVLPGVLGAIQATEAIKAILRQGELLVGRLLTYDAMDMSFREFRFARRPDCAACGDDSRISVSVGALPADEPPVTLRRLAPTELAAWLADPARGAVRLIDVREPEEFAAGHLPGAESIPLAQIEHTKWHVPHGSSTVFVCRSGARSLRACVAAAQQGLSDPGHLEGGLLAWAATVDPTLPVA